MIKVRTMILLAVFAGVFMFGAFAMEFCNSHDAMECFGTILNDSGGLVFANSSFVHLEMVRDASLALTSGNMAGTFLTALFLVLFLAWRNSMLPMRDISLSLALLQSDRFSARPVFLEPKRSIASWYSLFEHSPSFA